MKRTINEIAEIAQVAKSTVSKALNGQKGVSEKKRKQILELAARLEYEPNSSAQALASSRTGSIGLLLPHEAGYSISGGFWSAIITSIAQTANEHNYSLLILTPKSDTDISGPIETVLRRRNVDGLIIGAEQLDASMIARLDGEGIPFVFLGQSPLDGYCSVDADNAGGSERLIKHMINSGYRKIACLSGPAEYLYSRERVDGYKSALKKANIAWQAVEHSVYAADAVKNAIGRILLAHPDLDALYVTAGGDMLLDSIDALRSAGKDLGKFGLGSYDYYRFFDYLGCPVFAIRQPLRELGATAANNLFILLSGGKPESMNGILDVEMVLRR